MRIELLDGVGNPLVLPATRVVVYDDYDNPIALVVKHRQGFIYAGHVRDKEFQDYLHILGIDKTVIVNELDPKKLPPV